jgi:hypothetical protein
MSLAYAHMLFGNADIPTMKKGIALILACACLPAYCLDWKIPIFTLKYEVAHGASEDADDEWMMPSSLRNTVSLRMKEEADPAAFGLTVRCSAKEYFQQSGDYAYFAMDHDGSVRLSDLLRLEYLLGGKRSTFPGSTGLSKDYLSLKAGSSATLKLAKGTSIDAGLSARSDLADTEARALQVYALSAGFASRIGEWQFSARYRGEFRLPLGAQSERGTDAYNTGSVSLQWDPNR